MSLVTNEMFTIIYIYKKLTKTLINTFEHLQLSSPRHSVAAFASQSHFLNGSIHIN